MPGRDGVSRERSGWFPRGLALAGVVLAPVATVISPDWIRYTQELEERFVVSSGGLRILLLLAIAGAVALTVWRPSGLRLLLGAVVVVLAGLAFWAELGLTASQSDTTIVGSPGLGTWFFLSWLPSAVAVVSATVEMSGRRVPHETAPA